MSAAKPALRPALVLSFSVVEDLPGPAEKNPLARDTAGTDGDRVEACSGTIAGVG